MLSLYTAEIKEYLKCDDVVDFDKPEVKALADKLFAEAEGGTDFVRRAYEYVRDTFPHSADINADEIAVSASDVLKTGHGICHAKAHLLAAILRSRGVPTGFCYQKLILDDDAAPVYISHGLNGVYLREYDKWIRLDARGNRSDVDAQFSVDEEKLAFPVRAEKGEEDDLTVYADPKDFVIKSLRESKTRTELWINLPAATSIDSTRRGFEESFSVGTFYNRQTQDAEHLDEILSFVHFKKGMKILDLGTGSGYLAFRIAKDNPGCIVTGLDIVSATLEANTKRAQEEGDGGTHEAVLRDYGVPERIAEGRSESSGAKRAEIGQRMGRAFKAERESGGHGTGHSTAEEVACRSQRGGSGGAAAERIACPGETGYDHEQGAYQGRRREAGRHERGKADKGDGKAGDLTSIGVEALIDAPADHAELDGDVQDERAGGRGDAHIGQREGQHVHEEAHAASP